MQRITRRIALLAMIAAVVAAVLAVAGARADLRVTVGPNVNMSVQSGNQSEVGIALNPTNTSQLWAGWNPAGPIFSKRSTDGGTTWVAAPMDLTQGYCCDTQTAWDLDGNLWVTYLNRNLAPPNAVDRVKLEWSQDGGASFADVPGLTEAGTIDSGGVDQPTVAVGGPSGSRLVCVTWNDGVIKVRCAPVTGLGTIGAWTAEVQPPSATGQFGDIAIGPAGQISVTYQNDVLNPSFGSANIFVNTDPDGLTGGLVFGAQVLATTTNVTTFDFVPAQDGRSVDAEADLEYHSSGGAFNGRLYMVYTDEVVDESNDTNIMLRISTDNGATWGAAVKLNDDVTTRTQMLPHAALDRSTGRMGVSWHDARNDAGNNNTEYWGTIVTAGGGAFEANFKISAGVSNEDLAQPGGGIDYGDYSWSDFHAGNFHPAWADNSNSTGNNPDGTARFDIYTAKIATPTALTVLDLRATKTAGGHVAVSWRSAQEAAVLGYNVFRTAQGRTTKINSALMRAKAAGRAAGTAYRIVDRHARPGTSYTYRLQVLGLGGDRWWQGTALLSG